MDLVTLALAKSYMDKKISEEGVIAGATPQQAAQIEQNRADIADLQAEIEGNYVKSINGMGPDESGNVEIPAGTELDTTLTVEGRAADAKAVGDAISKISGQNASIPTSADLNGTTATFRNSAGIALFTIDLSGLGGSAAVYGNLVLSAEELTITEGQSGTFTVTLDKVPSANQPVYLAVSDGSRLSVEPAVLTFTPENWETPQTVTATSLEDDDELDNAITVTLTSTAVDARQVAVAVVDNDGIATLVTDGLVLNMDYSGHADDTSTTIEDLASGVSFSGFDQFNKVENGIYGQGTYKYLTVVEDEVKTAFVDAVRQSGEFTLEMFGLIAPAAFYLPNYEGAFTWITSDGYDGPLKKGSLKGKCWYTSTSGETTQGTTDQPFLFTHNGTQVNATTNNSHFNVLPYHNEFTHIVKTYSADGTVRCVVNGTPMEAPVTFEDFAEWDIDKMFGGDWSLLNSKIGSETAYLSSQRIYNRVLTDDEIVQNMYYNAEKLGLTTF